MAQPGAFRRGPDARRGPGYRRPRGHTLADYIRGQTRQGKELVDSLLEIARGEATTQREVAAKNGSVVTLTDRPSHRERLVALQALIDRGLGTAIPQDKMPAPPVAEEGESDLAEVLKLLQTPTAPEVASPTVERGGDSGDEGQGNGGAA